MRFIEVFREKELTSRYFNLRLLSGIEVNQSGLNNKDAYDLEIYFIGTERPIRVNHIPITKGRANFLQQKLLKLLNSDKKVITINLDYSSGRIY